MEKPIVKTLSVWMGINSSEQKMEAFRKIAVIVIGWGQVQIKRPMLGALRVLDITSAAINSFEMPTSSGSDFKRKMFCDGKKS